MDNNFSLNESPINEYIGEIRSQIISNEENQLMNSVDQSIGFHINKEELIKALQYDRDQYNKGYKDGSNYVLNKLKSDIKYIKNLYNLSKNEPTVMLFLEGIEFIEKIIDSCM